MDSFFTILEQRARQINSLLCIGLDPHPADLPEPGVSGLRAFCLRLIEATAEVALAFKPNSAFFEAYGPEGMAALKDVIAAVPAGIPVLLDAKRGDISSTAEAYGRAAFEAFGAQAMTASPYLGHDSLEPLLQDAQRGVFLLCKTSNPGSADLQDLALADGELIYEHVVGLAHSWNTRNNLGLVVGATHPEALRRVRGLAPELWILAPGVGAQGGDLRQALAAGLRADGLGLLIPVSRAVARAADPRQAALALCAEIRLVVQALTAAPAAQPPSDLRLRVMDELLNVGCVKFGQFTLKSGLLSPIYLDLRELVSYPSLLADVARCYLPLLRRLSFARLAALPYAALPIATAISLQAGWPMLYPRKEVKAYGTRANIEGRFETGEVVAVIDDLATTGESKFEAIEKLTGAGLKVQDVVVLIDRQSGASEALAQAGYQLHAVFNLVEMLAYWEKSGRISAQQAADTRAFLRSTGDK